MATIAFFLDAEQGHLLATFPLAGALVSRGHRVVFLSFAPAGPMVRQQGFEFIPIFNGVVPEETRSAANLIKSLFAPLIAGDTLDEIVRQLGPAIFITLTAFTLFALVLKHRYGYPVALLRPHCFFRQRRDVCRRVVTDDLMLLSAGAAAFLELLESKGQTVRSFSDIGDLALLLPELVLFPPEFVPDAIRTDPLLYYISPGADTQRETHEQPFAVPPGTSPLVYCSLGSQWALKSKASRRLFEMTLEVFAKHPEYRLLLSTGKTKLTLAVPRSSNIMVTDWAPQLAILKLATAMITHAGSGSIKECVTAGVPIIAAPLARDQFDCANNITRLGMGVTVDVEKSGPVEFERQILRVIQEPSFRNRVQDMQAKFLDSDWPLAASLIEQWAPAGG